MEEKKDFRSPPAITAASKKELLYIVPGREKKKSNSKTIVRGVSN